MAKGPPFPCPPWSWVPRQGSIRPRASYLHVIDAVWREGVIRLVSQGGAVLGYVVIGLGHINDCFLVEGESVPI